MKLANNQELKLGYLGEKIAPFTLLTDENIEVNKLSKIKSLFDKVINNLSKRDFIFKV